MRYVKSLLWVFGFAFSISLATQDTHEWLRIVGFGLMGAVLAPVTDHLWPKSDAA